MTFLLDAVARAIGSLSTIENTCPNCAQVTLDPNERARHIEFGEGCTSPEFVLELDVATGQWLADELETVADVDLYFIESDRAIAKALAAQLDDDERRMLQLTSDEARWLRTLILDMQFDVDEHDKAALADGVLAMLPKPKVVTDSIRDQHVNVVGGWR